MLLYALGRYSRGGERLIPYAEVDVDLGQLLAEFGPYRKTYHPEYPFWHLQSDGLWEIAAVEAIRPNRGGSAGRGDLLRCAARGGFPQPVYDAVVADPLLAARLAHLLLEGHFPSSLHEDILSAVGLDSAFTIAKRRRRDAEFRSRVLVAYEYRCAVCDYDIRLGNTHAGLEAAHIMWHQAGGPDREENGLALCALHHKLFDLGAFTLSDDRVVMLSNLVYGNHRFDQYLLVFHGRPLRLPHDPRLSPHPTFIRWHRREVFKGEPRYPARRDRGEAYAAERRDAGSYR